jgi:hypothetical protein
MEVEIEKLQEVIWETETKGVKLYNPTAIDYSLDHRVKSIEITENYTRIDFIFRSSKVYINGGWIQIDRNSYIAPVGSDVKYKLIKAEGIPIAPTKHYFKRQGETHCYSLLFPALPKDTKRIDIIEKLERGTYFNFFNVDFSEWMSIPHPADMHRSSN